MGFLHIAVGDRVVAGGGEAIITHVISADQVIVRDLTTGAVQQVPIRRERQKVGGEYRNSMILRNHAQRTLRYDPPTCWRLGDLAASELQGRR